MTLKTSKGEELTVRIPAGPILQDGMVTLVPGESFVVILSEKDGKLQVQRLGDAELGSGRVFKASFQQMTETAKPPAMLLVVENKNERRLKYRARFVQPTSRRAESTTVCEVLPGKASFEQWPFPIREVQLYDFLYVEHVEGSDVRCE